VASLTFPHLSQTRTGGEVASLTSLTLKTHFLKHVLPAARNPSFRQVLADPPPTWAVPRPGQISLRFDRPDGLCRSAGPLSKRAVGCGREVASLTSLTCLRRGRSSCGQISLRFDRPHGRLTLNLKRFPAGRRRVRSSAKAPWGP